MALDGMSDTSGAAASDGQPFDVLTLNCGSSSLKFGLYRVGATRVETLLEGAAESVGAPEGRFHARDASGAISVCESASFPSQGEAADRVAALLAACDVPMPSAIGHRIVHGGPHLQRHCLVDDAVLGKIEAAAAFAPLHVPPALSVLRFARARFASCPQVACFDTTFHADLPDVARILPVPRTLADEGIRRYGFHGLSCESILRQLGDDAPARIVIAHLGSGASVTAVAAGRSIDTSMGLTPSGGIIMGTRCGDLDPGLLIHLMRRDNLDADGLEDVVDRRSGLLGLSGVGGDMRQLHQAAASNPDARLAVAMFCASARKEIAAMTTSLGGVDLIVFTGGIGENDAIVRAAICDGLSWFGIHIDEARHRSGGMPLSTPDSRCVVRVMPSEEDEEIARRTASLVLGHPLDRDQATAPEAQGLPRG